MSAARRRILLGALPACAAAVWVVTTQARAAWLAALGLALVAAPFAEVALARRLHPARRQHALLAGLMLQLTGLTLCEASPSALWAALVCQALARARHPAAAAVGGLLALGLSVVTLRVSDAAPLVLVPFLVVLGVVPGLLALASDAARARAARARAPGADAAAPRRPALGPALAAWPALLAVLVVSARLTDLDGREPRARAQVERERERVEEREPPAGEARVTRWSDRMSFGEGVGRLSDEVVLWAAPEVRPRGALYLTVLALDTFDERGLGQPRLDALRELDDLEDGRADGWIRLLPRDGTESLRVAVAQRPLRVGALGGDALVRLEPLHALSLERALYDRDTALVLPGEREGVFRYAFEAAHPDAGAAPPRDARAAHPDPRYVQLPPPSPELELLGARAATLLGRAEGDPARVAALLAHFARDFDYSLAGGGFVGVAGVAEFLEQRAGYCTSFAASAVLLLRSQGIACRAVGGYLADEWDDGRGAYAVRGRDAHAWIEVHYEGLGWRTYDPTPAAERERAFDRRDGLLAPELGEWTSGLSASVGEALRGGVDGPGLARLGAQLAEAPAVLRQELQDLPPTSRAGLLLVLALGLVAAFLAPRAARPGPEGAPPRARWSLRPRGAYAALLEALARAGWSPSTSESLRAFARRVEAAGVLVGFDLVTEDHLAERFGGRAPDDAARERARGLLPAARLIAGAAPRT